MNFTKTLFDEYLANKKSGQRKSAMRALNDFLNNCEKLDVGGQRKVITDFFQQNNETRDLAYSFPLNSRLLFPVLQAWCAENPTESWIWRSFAEIALLRQYLTAAQGDTLAINENAPLDDLPIRKALCKALELDPADHLARIIYIDVLLETLKLLLHDQEAGDATAAEQIPEEVKKISDQLTLLPDSQEKSRLQEQYIIYRDKFIG